MDTVRIGKELLRSATEEYSPQDRGNGAVYLEKLRLFIELREVQSMDRGSVSVFISEVNASAHERQKGICITCVGLGADMRSAVSEAVAHWTLGVLPVLAQWRGQHSCLSGSRQLETRKGQFTLLAGPTIMRGRSEGDTPPAESSAAFWQLLEPVLRARPLTQIVHWLELFASKAGDGSVEATCRLNNRDWNAGRRFLESVASAWQIPQEPLRSCRQFAMLVPKEGNTEEIILPSFWDRVLSRA